MRLKILALCLMLAGAALITMPVLAGSWYEGGTLHNSNLATWKNATAVNRLATAADWTTAMLKGRDWESMEEVRRFSKNLVICIDEVAIDPQVGSLSASEIAATCAVLLGWS